jgi:hypothetical protein
MIASRPAFPMLALALTLTLAASAAAAVTTASTAVPVPVPVPASSRPASAPAPACAARQGASAVAGVRTSKLRHIPDEHDPCASSTGAAPRIER